MAILTARSLIVGLALAGVAGVIPIVTKQFSGAAACPLLGPVPACYLVLLGYVLIAVSVCVGKRSRILVFALGWLPLFALAATGSGLELFGQQACPRSSAGVPACYLSLGLLSFLGLVFLAEKRGSMTND